MFSRLMEQKHTNDGSANMSDFYLTACLLSLASSYEVVLVGGFVFIYSGLS